MRVVDEKAVEVHWHKREISIEDGPVEKITRASWHVPNARKSFQVDLITARWDHGKTPEHIELSGPILLANGTPGKVRAHVTYVPEGTDTRLYLTLPGWVSELLAGKVPLPGPGVAKGHHGDT
jgi:hypothetical protein